MKDIKLFIGSVDGVTEHAGTILADALEALSYSVDVNSNPKLNDILNLRDNLRDNLQDNLQDQLLLIITSTTGEGELPHDLRPLWRKLYTKSPSLAGIHYAMTVLGDSSYGDDFCLAGKELDALLEKLGAQRIKQTLLIDAEENVFPEDDISAWGVATANDYFAE